MNQNWQKYDPENENSFSLFVAKKILEYNADVRDYMNNYESMGEDICACFSSKYNTMRGNLNNEIKKQSFDEFVFKQINFL